MSSECLFFIKILQHNNESPGHTYSFFLVPFPGNPTLLDSNVIVNIKKILLTQQKLYVRL